MNSEKYLLQIAAENPDIPGKAGDVLRAHLAERAALGLMRDIQLAHCRARETWVNRATAELRCGALLLTVPAGDLERVLRVADLPAQTALEYTRKAVGHPELASIAKRRFGRITEAQALSVLQDAQP